MSLKRRDLLRDGAVLAITATAGCISLRPPGGDEPGQDDDSTDADSGNGTPDSGENDSVPKLTGHSVSEQVVTPSAERFSDLDAWGLFVESREAAMDYFGDVDESGAEAVRTFIAETAFDAGDRLVYLHAFAPQTCYELVLAGKPRITQDGLPLVIAEVSRTAPADQPCGDAMTPVRLLCRLSFDPVAGIPNSVTAEISGHRDEPEHLRIEAAQ